MNEKPHWEEPRADVLEVEQIEESADMETAFASFCSDLTLDL
ncbi:hypothetical protein [Parafrankia elaeagni]|nr:hypothetical protein [Parafrankia elaeagni]